MTASSNIPELQQQLEERTSQLQQLSEELLEMLEEIEVVQEERYVQNEELESMREAVELERQRYHDLFEFAPDGYLLTDGNGMIREANFAAARLLCVPQHHLVGKPLVLFFAEPERKTFHTRLMKLRQVHSDWEVYLLPRLGTPFPAAITVAGAYNLQGKLVRVRWLIRDISDRKQAEDSIKFQANVLAQVKDAVHAVNCEGRILYWNQGAELLYNHKADEVLGTRLEEVYQSPWHYWEQESAICDSLAKTGSWQGETIHILKTGKEMYVDESISILKDDSGTIIGFLAVNRDITERKLAEEKIRQQAALLDITTDAILVRNLQHQILFWNKGAEYLYGWQTAEVLGKNANELLYRDVKKSPNIPEIEQNLAKKGFWQGELQQITKNGKTILVESRWTLVCDKQGEPESILVVNTDITEKKQLEAQFFRTQRLESLGTLASGIAHDFNNLLTPILAVAQLLPTKLPNLDERNQQLLNILEDSAKRGAALVKQILSFARGGTEGKRTVLDVKYLLKEVAQITSKTFPKSIQISLDTGHENLWIISADANQLHQILLNLCVNARDAMPDGGVLSLVAENIFVDENYARIKSDAHVGSYVAITVSDTGTGIPPEVLERIFEPFFTTKAPGKGTGLGLASVIGIVKNHLGFVTVDSEVGKGSKFQVYLPAIEEKETQAEEDLEVPKGSGELILVVDDEEAIKQISQISLEDHNYKTLIANDGNEAIALYAQHKNEISVVLMDIMMPSMDGLIAIRTLQSMNHQVKIIATSGLVFNNQLAKAAGISVKAFLSKPYTRKELFKTIHAVISSG
ncbi:MAG: PAS domain S-box protein [Stigonema ocellatum SAG 48.90 = DSM 106950]|nr:PAS domain S-box protein [Stigonema ocellatum SAG 48.90 = DSM 106950]